MKLRSFRVRHFRSIIDSGVCYLGSPITVIAGLNGSGKSSILEALSLFKYNNGFNPEAAHEPIHGSPEQSELSLVFDLAREDLTAIAEALGTKLAPKAEREWLASGLRITTRPDGFIYNIPSGVPDVSVAARKELLEKVRECIVQFDSVTSNSLQATLPGPDREEWRPFDEAITHIEAMSQEQPKDLTLQSIAKRSREIFEEYRSKRQGVKLARLFVQIGPPIVLILGGTLGAGDKSQVATLIQRLLALANVKDIDSLRTLAIPRRRRSLAKVAEVVNDPLQEILSDETVNFALEIEAAESFFGLQRGSAWFAPDQISGGTSSLLNLLLPLLELARPTIVLIDEPESSLHVDAQLRLYSRLCDMGRRHAIILATQSPFMLPADNLLNAKAVENGPDGSVVRNSPHDVEGAETLSPLYEAIGFGVAAWNPMIGNKNVLLEGLTDSIYVNAVVPHMEHVPAIAELSILPLIGASRAQHIASILEAWRLPYVVVLDNDNAGRSAGRVFARSGRSENIVSVAADPKRTIEDLIATTDFDALAMRGQSFKRSDGESNSAMIKRLRLNKTALAATFAENAKEPGTALSAATIAAFGELFSQIITALQAIADKRKRKAT